MYFLLFYHISFHILLCAFYWYFYRSSFFSSLHLYHQWNLKENRPPNPHSRTTLKPYQSKIKKQTQPLLCQ